MLNNRKQEYLAHTMSESHEKYLRLCLRSPIYLNNLGILPELTERSPTVFSVYTKVRVS